MSRKAWFCLFVLAVLIVGFFVTQPVFAETTFKWGPYLRIRHEYWNDWSDYSSDALDNRNFFRIKSSLWGQVQLDKNSTLYAKLTNENREWLYYNPTTAKPDSTGVTSKGYHGDINEVVFDNLYLDLKNVFGYPVDLRLGRQDFMGMYGEGFLISDGTPQDGSRTMYHDALKGSWKINKEHSLDVLLIKNDRTDEKLPVINRNDGKARDNTIEQNNNLTDEEGIVVYLKSNPSKALQLENYYIYKTEEGKAATRFNKYETELNTLGSFAKYTFGPYILKGQLAYQVGKYGDYDRTGLGGYTFLTRSFKDVMFKPTANMGYMYLSGDDDDGGGARDDKITGWDPLFSRWPVVSDMYSELYYLSFNTEGSALGYWTNLQMYKAGVALVPTKKTKLTLAYYYLRANEAQSWSSTFSGTEKNRGSLFTGKLDYSFNKNITAFLQGEYFLPGDFYKSSNRSEGVFLRTQLELKY